MTGQSFALFDTPIGQCGVMWWCARHLRRAIAGGERGANPCASHAALSACAEGSPPPQVRHAIEAIAALLAGEPRDSSAVALDMDGVPEFDRRVYKAARSIAAGNTLSYGELAARNGERGLARDVGQALGRNPFPIIVPCHRVLAAGGRSGGFSANGGVATQAPPAQRSNARARAMRPRCSTAMTASASR